MLTTEVHHPPHLVFFDMASNFRYVEQEENLTPLSCKKKCFNGRVAVITLLNNQTKQQSPDWSGGTALCGSLKTTHPLLLPEWGLYRLETCGAVTNISLNNTKYIKCESCDVLQSNFSFVLGLYKKYNNTEYAICLCSAAVNDASCYC